MEEGREGVTGPRTPASLTHTATPDGPSQSKLLDHKMHNLITVVLLLLAGGRSTVPVGSVLMPGSTPSSPNPNLRDCLVHAGYYNVTDSPAHYNNDFARAVHRWCSVYEAVLPCAESSAKSNPLRSPSDWFFSLIFNSSIANHTSSTICQKLSKFGRKLRCMRKAQELRALRCVDSLTKPIKKALMKIYLTNMSMVDLAQKASCLISAATATCFREKVSSCRAYLRDYIGAYNLIFGGKCIAFLRSRDKNETTTDDALTPQSLDQEWMTTIQNLVNEGNKLKIYQRNESRRGDIISEVTEIPSTPTALTTPGFIFTDLGITRASVKHTQTTASVSMGTKSTSRFIFDSKGRELFQTSTAQVSVQRPSTGDSGNSGDTSTGIGGSIDNGASRDKSSGGEMIVAQHIALLFIITVSVVFFGY